MSTVGFSQNSSDVEVLVRYAFPGTIAIIPLAYYISLIDFTIVSYLSIALVLLVVPVGYIMYQIWLMAFTATGINENGYCRYGRENLIKLSREIKNEGRYNTTHNFKQSSIMEEINNHVQKITSNPKKQDRCEKDILMILSYYAWESWVYDKAPQGHTIRSGRLWQFYHGASSSALASWISFIFFVVISMVMLHTNLSIVYAGAIGSFGMGILMMVRAKQLFREVVTWETMMLYSDSKNIEDMIAKVLKFFETELKDRILSNAC
ncbi:MAG: hypothetical protein ACYDAZ_04960 [Thermoplasmataceae archaeon]